MIFNFIRHGSLLHCRWVRFPFPGIDFSLHYNFTSSVLYHFQKISSVSCLQLTTKAVEKDSRNRTPHFLCGRLTMNDSTFTVHSPVPNIPIFLKKPVSENGEKQRCLRSLLNESPNRYASPVSDAQPLGRLINYTPDFKSPEHL